MLSLQCFGMCGLSEWDRGKRSRLELEKRDSTVGVTTSHPHLLGQVASCLQLTFPNLQSKSVAPIISEAPSSSKSPLSQMHLSVRWVPKQHSLETVLLKMKRTAQEPQGTCLEDTVQCISPPSDGISASRKFGL